MTTKLPSSMVESTLQTNVQSGTSYTLTLTDMSKRVSMTNAGANTVTVPPNSSVAFPVGSIVFVTQDGAGATSLAAGSGVTINKPDGLLVGGQYKMVSVLKTAADVWLAVGAVE